MPPRTATPTLSPCTRHPRPAAETLAEGELLLLGVRYDDGSEEMTRPLRYKEAKADGEPVGALIDSYQLLRRRRRPRRRALAHPCNHLRTHPPTHPPTPPTLPTPPTPPAPPTHAGFQMDDTKSFNSRVLQLLAKELGVTDLTVEKEAPPGEEGVRLCVAGSRGFGLRG